MHSTLFTRTSPPPSIARTTGHKPIAAGVVAEIVFHEAVERVLDREAAVDVVHVVIDDEVMLLVRFVWRRRNRYRQRIA